MRRAARGLAGAAVTLVVATALLWAASAPARGSTPVVVAVGPIAMTVSDADRSADFYRRVLGFERVWDTEVSGEAYERLHGLAGLRLRVVRLRLGEEALDLMEYVTPRGRPVPADSRSHDRWFQHIAIIVSDIDRAYAHLRAHRVEHVSPAPQRLPDWNPNAGGIRAFYFKDPDGHPLEILWFPPGKGDARWHVRGKQLFLGIDHTAIVVADTPRSLACYRDGLGLRVAGESENWGPEQEHLNNVTGARLRITTLRAASGPGVELLEYVTPRDGRPIPGDTHPNDLAYWQTTLASDDATALQERLRSGACTIRSVEMVTVERRALGFTRGVLGHDPDGHAFQIIER
ncbi:MAG TPA: VOC family protein [Methylomirabilota bacterium]|jgi:catechol 2,3-dioxygenase-like lactoylglutathione lyase family enzyme